jgi:hypothetical protein
MTQHRRDLATMAEEAAAETEFGPDTANVH